VKFVLFSTHSWQVFGLCRLPTCFGFPAQPASACLKRSFLLTAAGQLRILTGFPFQPQSRDRGTMKFTHYSKGNMSGQHLYLVVYSQIPTIPSPHLELVKPQ